MNPIIPPALGIIPNFQLTPIIETTYRIAQKIFRAIASFFTSIVQYFTKEKLPQDEPQLTHAERIEYDRGVSVHQGDRLQRTAFGINLLQIHQGAIPRDRRERARDEFISHLETKPMDKSKKRAARHALLGRSSYDDHWPSLLSSDSIYIADSFNISGTELIGRLWIFAESLPDPENMNVKDSMINALSTSYHFGKRVCNQGKVERLVIATLQGRLAGVNIDNAHVPTPPTTAESITAFFNNEANREIDEYGPLLSAARKFCQENPLVEKAGFIREVRMYAQSMGITPA